MCIQNFEKFTSLISKLQDASIKLLIKSVCRVISTVWVFTQPCKATWKNNSSSPVDNNNNHNHNNNNNKEEEQEEGRLEILKVMKWVIFVLKWIPNREFFKKLIFLLKIRATFNVNLQPNREFFKMFILLLQIRATVPLTKWNMASIARQALVGKLN